MAGCSVPVIISIEVPPALSPGTPVIAPYVEVAYGYPQNPSEFCYAMFAEVWCQQIPGAVSYNVQATVNGKVVWTDTIPQSGIPYQYAQLAGYFFAPMNNFFNTSLCSNTGYMTGQIQFASTDTVEFSYQACNANGCSNWSPATGAKNISSGTYGPPPTGICSAAPGAVTGVTVTNPSIGALGLKWNAVSCADAYYLIDMDQGPDFHLAGVGGTSFTLPSTLLPSLGLKAGDTFHLGIAAYNLIGIGPITTVAITLTS